LTLTLGNTVENSKTLLYYLEQIMCKIRCYKMVTLEKEIKEIKERLNELVTIYKTIIDLLLKEEKPLNDEKKALESEEEIISEKDLIEALKR